MKLAPITFILVATSAATETRIIDGDSLIVNGRETRLFGIDAPEGRDPGGTEATGELQRLVGRRDPCVYRIFRPVRLGDESG